MWASTQALLLLLYLGAPSPAVAHRPAAAELPSRGALALEFESDLLEQLAEAHSSANAAAEKTPTPTLPSASQRAIDSLNAQGEAMGTGGTPATATPPGTPSSPKTPLTVPQTLPESSKRAIAALDKLQSQKDAVVMGLPPAPDTTPPDTPLNPGDKITVAGEEHTIPAPPPSVTLSVDCQWAIRDMRNSLVHPMDSLARLQRSANVMTTRAKGTKVRNFAMAASVLQAAIEKFAPEGEAAEESLVIYGGHASTEDWKVVQDHWQGLASACGDESEGSLGWAMYTMSSLAGDIESKLRQSKYQAVVGQYVQFERDVVNAVVEFSRELRYASDSAGKYCPSIDPEWVQKFGDLWLQVYANFESTGLNDLGLTKSDNGTPL